MQHKTTNGQSKKQYTTFSCTFADFFFSYTCINMTHILFSFCIFIWLTAYKQLFCLNFHRLDYGESYFRVLPPLLKDIFVNYAKACDCSRKKTDNDKCQNAFDVAFPNVMLSNKKLSPMLVCTERGKRDVYSSDDPTEEDFQIFKKFPELQPRFKRAAKISKEDANRYCTERISDTKIGKICAKVGVNLQELVKTCALDLEVSKNDLYDI